MYWSYRAKLSQQCRFRLTDSKDGILCSNHPNTHTIVEEVVDKRCSNCDFIWHWHKSQRGQNHRELTPAPQWFSPKVVGYIGANQHTIEHGVVVRSATLNNGP